jgi:hypothetical protein
MTSLKVTSNYKPREALCWHDLTDKEKKKFDYLDSEEKQSEASFFRYRKWVYDMGEFMLIPHGSELHDRGWQGFASDTYFSGVCFKYCDKKCEAFIVGSFYS